MRLWFVYAQGKSVPLLGELWWTALSQAGAQLQFWGNLRTVGPEKGFSRGQEKLWRHCNKRSSRNLLFADLEKIAFGLRGLWGGVQSAAWRPPVQQVKLFPEMTLSWLKCLCSLLDVTLPEPGSLSLARFFFHVHSKTGFLRGVFWAQNSFVLEIAVSVPRSRWGKLWEKGGGFVQRAVSKPWVKTLLRCCSVLCHWHADS